MSVRHIDYLKIKPSRILVVEIRPVRCIIETSSGPTRTAKWMTYKHWKELRFMLNEIADHYEEQRISQKTTEEVECNKGKTKEGSTIKIGYMFTTYRKCSCVYMTPRDTWSDDEDDEDEDDELRDKGGRYQQFLPCGEMLVVSVALQDTVSPSQGEDIQKSQTGVRASRSELESSFMSPARSDRQLLKALDSSIVFTNTISDYFGSSQKKSLEESSSAETQVKKEIKSKDKQSTLRNMVSKSKLKNKRKHGDSSSNTLQSENELPNKRQVTKQISKFDNNVMDDLSEDLLGEYPSDIKDIIRNEDLPHAEDYSENSLTIDKESESSLKSQHSSLYQNRSSVQDSVTVKSSKDNFESGHNHSSLKKNARDSRNNNLHTCQDKKTSFTSHSPVLQRRVNCNALSLPQVVKGSDAGYMNKDNATENGKGIVTSTPDIFTRHEVHLPQEEEEKTKRKQKKLHTLFGDCDMPWEKKDGCHEVKETKKAMLGTDQKYIPLSIKDKKTLQEVESVTKPIKSVPRKEKHNEKSEILDNDDSSHCRRSSRIKQNKEKCAVKERKSCNGDDHSDKSLSQSMETEVSHSPLSKENLDSSALSVNDILLSGRNVKKISSSAETLKAIAQLEKIRKDIEKLDQYDDSLLENDHLDLSQTSDKDFKPFKKSNNKKNLKNLPSDQKVLDGWISPKVTTDKKGSNKTSKIKIDKSNNNVNAKNEKKITEEESKKVLLKEKNCKVKKRVSKKSEKVEDTQKGIFASCKSTSKKDKKLTQTTLLNIRKPTKESVSSDYSLSTQSDTVNLQGVSVENCLEHASDSQEENDSLPDLDLSNDRDYQFESIEDQGNYIPQNDSRCSDHLLSSQDVGSEELTLKYEGSSPINSPCEPQIDQEAKEKESFSKDRAESDGTSSPDPAPWLELRNRLIAMSLEELDEHMKTILPYLKKISRGQEPSRRHEIFKEGGKDFRYLADDLLFGPFTEDHILHAVDYLNKEFSKSVERACGKDRVNEYIWKVLVPSLFIRIVMENENMTSSEAEQIMVEVSMNKKIDYSCFMESDQI